MTESWIWVEKDTKRRYFGSEGQTGRYWFHVELSGDPYEDIHTAYGTKEELLAAVKSFTDDVNAAYEQAKRLP